jgi:hypothetical protein
MGAICILTSRGITPYSYVPELLDLLGAAGFGTMITGSKQ